MTFRRFEKRINKITLVLFIISFFYTASLFIAPLTLEPGTVERLDGEANTLTYPEKWEELPTYHRVIYTFSDMNCHQKYYRSFSINGNQVPVCARDVGIFSGISLGFFAMIMIVPEKGYKDILLKFIPMDSDLSESRKNIVLVILGGLFVLPMAIDGGVQLVTAYESTNIIRLITGLIFGFGFSVFISALLLSTSMVVKDSHSTPS